MAVKLFNVKLFNTTISFQPRMSIYSLAVVFLGCLIPFAIQAQQLDNDAVIQRVDAAVHARLERIASYTVIEHYAVYRNKDEAHPVAEMTVKTLYQKDAGKSYTILSQSGSEIVRNLVLSKILDSEKQINQPGMREGSWFTSANYEMKLKPEANQRLDGRDCIALSVTPKRKTHFLIEGTIWVDPRDYGVVQIQGVGSKAPSIVTGPAQMERQYTNVNGFAMATHAKAISNSFLFGQTTVKVDYTDYQIQLVPAK